MQFKSFKSILAAGALFAVLGAGNVFGQADSKALTEMLVKKGILTNQEAADLAAKYNKVDKGYTKIKVASWLDELKIYGDVRLRYDDLFGRQIAGSATGTSDEQDRSRYRYRLRAGATAKAGEWQAGFRLISQDGTAQPLDPISGNATETRFFDKKGIAIDTAFLQYDPKFADGLTLMGGKFDNPFWETDMAFDPDITPEGFAEKYKLSLNDNVSVFVNTMQSMILENNVGTGVPAVSADSTIRGKDEYLFGFQGGAKASFIPKKLELTSAVGFYDYEGLENVALGAANVSGGDAFNNWIGLYYGNTVPVDTFKVFTCNNELRIGYWDVNPIRLQFEYMNNLGSNFLYGGSIYQNEGFKGGLVLGDAQKKGDWQIGYWYEYLGANANFSIFSDSDFGTGGTNEKGHILKAAYYLTDYVSVGVSYWNVSPISPSLPLPGSAAGANAVGATTGGGSTTGVGGASYGQVQRIFLDLMMKF